MPTRKLTKTEEWECYDTWVRMHPAGSLWQSLEWKRYQESLGRETGIYVEEDKEKIVASALVIIDRTTGGLSVWDIPRGPLAVEGYTSKVCPVPERSDWCGVEGLLERIVEDAKQYRTLNIYLSPRKELSTCNVRPVTRESPRHEQPEATRIIDLTQSEEKILAQMKPKGRYNIRVAQKHNVRVSESKDIDVFYALLEETAHRDGFVAKPKAHYKRFLTDLQGSFLLMAYSDNSEAIAGLLGVVWGDGGIYYYGASNHAERAKMAPYLLQWEAMQLCKAKRCKTYDLLGVAPKGPGHPWAGVSVFKEKFGGQVFTYPPEQQIVLRPLTQGLLNMKRRLFG